MLSTLALIPIELDKQQWPTLVVSFVKRRQLDGTLQAQECYVRQQQYH